MLIPPPPAIELPTMATYEGFILRRASDEALAIPVWLNPSDRQLSPDDYSVSLRPAHVEMLTKQLEEISQLPYNWDGYGGVVPSNQAIDNALRLLANLSDATVLQLSNESITPSPYGTVSFEWELDDFYYVRVEVGDNEWAYFYQLGNNEGEIENAPIMDTGALSALQATLDELYVSDVFCNSGEFPVTDSYFGGGIYYSSEPVTDYAYST